MAERAKAEIHSHAHAHGPLNFGRTFAIGIALNLIFVFAEVVFGFLANSMSLLADAGHNLSDVLGLAIAWVAAIMAKRAASPRFTYGLKKAPILAALGNSLILLVAVGAIAAEAVRRLFHPSATAGRIVIIVAMAGILINGATALLLARGRSRDINVKGAYLHMAADALVSFAVVLAGFLTLATKRQWIDPAMSLAVAVAILWGSIGLLKQSVAMFLAGVPEGINAAEVELALTRIEGVDAVHDLHIWPLSTTETALTAHVVTASADFPDELLERARTLLHDRFHIEHCTIQVERHHSSHHSDC
jgi:cobalt-zinc-cadmium efflux system protein